jgi:hypothetical protein
LAFDCSDDDTILGKIQLICCLLLALRNDHC